MPWWSRIRPALDAGSNVRRRWWAKALSDAGLPTDFKLRELRHTAASLAIRSGANIKALQNMLGHASADLTLDRYGQLYQSDVDAVGQAIDAEITVTCGHGVGTGHAAARHLRAFSADDLHKHWWARTVSNRRPLVCKTRALPLSYAPVPGKDTATTTRRPKRRLTVQAFSAVSASIHSRWSRASPGCFISANRIVPDRSMTNVPRLETPASSLNTP